MNGHKIPNVLVDTYLKDHKDCPMYQQACDLIDRTNKRGIIKGAQVVSKVFYLVSISMKRTRLVVGSRFVYLHNATGLMIRFICQQDIDTDNPKPVMWNCDNFLIDT